MWRGLCTCLSVAGSQASTARRKTTKSMEMHAVWVWTRKAQGTITVSDRAVISYENRHFLGNGNTWTYSDLPAFDIINLGHKATAATWPVAKTFMTTCLFYCFTGTVCRAVLVACNLE